MVDQPELRGIVEIHAPQLRLDFMSRNLRFQNHPVSLKVFDG